MGDENSDLVERQSVVDQLHNHEVSIKTSNVIDDYEKLDGIYSMMFVDKNVVVDDPYGFRLLVMGSYDVLLQNYEIAIGILSSKEPEQIFQKINDWDLFVGSVLNEFYSKYGGRGVAFKVFKEFEKSDVGLWTSIFNLQMYGKALQFSKWLKVEKHLDFITRDDAYHLYLITTEHGLQRADYYIQNVKKKFKREVLYRTLWANYILANKLKKADEVFNKMKDLEFPITSIVCDKLLLLYKRLDREKITVVLLLMAKENINLSLFTYSAIGNICESNSHLEESWAAFEAWERLSKTEETEAVKQVLDTMPMQDIAAVITLTFGCQ